MTAVNWLIEQIKSDQNQKALSANEWMQVIEQAKAMEKEQIIEAVESTINSIKLDDKKEGFICMNGEGYYKQTFNK